MRHFVLSAALVALLVMIASPARADEIAVTTGSFSVLDDSNSVAFGLEWRDASTFWGGFSSLAGAFVAGEAATYAYAGLAYDWDFAPKWTLRPSVSAGLYGKGSEIDLGNVVEFYSRLEVNYSFNERDKLAVSFGHISNAGIGSDNPGTEILNIGILTQF